jgi:hypothetical protein
VTAWLVLCTVAADPRTGFLGRVVSAAHPRSEAEQIARVRRDVLGVPHAIAQSRLGVRYHVGDPACEGTVTGATPVED